MKNIRNGQKPLKEILDEHLAKSQEADADDDEVVTSAGATPRNQQNTTETSQNFSLNNPLNEEA